MGEISKEYLDRYNYYIDSAVSLLNKKDRDRADGLLLFNEHLKNETDFFNAPASTKYHMSCEHGLLYHSVLVTTVLTQLQTLLAPDVPFESCVIAGLFHDVGKEGLYIKNEPTEKQKMYNLPANVPYLYKEKGVWFDHESRSLHMISKFLRLTDEEFNAILYHNEPWKSKNSSFKKNKLMTMLQNADYWSTLYLEGE